jgi:hypothetical protein
MSEMMESTAISVRESSGVTAQDFMPLFTVQQAVERKGMMNQFINEVLRENEDYGPMPGNPAGKKVLMKPGAEKLCSIFGMAPQYIEDKIIEDWTGEHHGGEPLFYYAYRCQLMRGGRFMGEAIGSCNSWEAKYRYRWITAEECHARGIKTDGLPARGGKRTLFEPEFALEKRQTTGQYGKPIEYWDQFDEAIREGRARKAEKSRRDGGKLVGFEMDIDQTVYRIPNPEIADTINTCQKMAQKRALVAAVLVVTNCSDAFTQDLDEAEEPHYDPAPITSNARTTPAGEPIKRMVPEELVSVFARIRADVRQMKPAFTKIGDLMIQKAGQAGEAEYSRITKAFREKHPTAATLKPSDVENCLLDLWEALQALPEIEVNV